VVFEVPVRMVGWGIKLFGPTDLERRISELISFFHPSIVVIRRKDKSGQFAHQNNSAIRAACRRSGVPLVSVRWSVIETSFRVSIHKNKHEIASVVSALFPELAVRLWRPRKRWQAQKWPVPIFDAAALALVYAAKIGGIFVPTTESLRQPPNDVAKDVGRRSLSGAGEGIEDA